MPLVKLRLIISRVQGYLTLFRKLVFANLRQGGKQCSESVVRNRKVLIFLALPGPDWGY